MNTKENAWIKTNTGKRFFAFDPKPDQVCIVDIAHALSKNNRFTGHCNRNYTVGEHSIHCARMLKQLGYSKKIQLMGLIHDASEAYLQDIAKPFKAFLPDYMEVEEKVQNAIWLKYLGYIPTDEEYQYVKMVDEVMLCVEIDQLMPQDDDWFLKINHDIETFPSVDLSIEYNSSVIKDIFINMAMELGVKEYE